MKQHTERMFAHVEWANRRVLKLLRSSDGEPASALRLLSHLLAAERVWLWRLRERDSSELQIWPELSVEEVSALGEANHSGYLRFLEEVAPKSLSRRVRYRNSKGVEFESRIVDVLTHVALHGSYHRGQIARAVREAGHEPVNTDYITYVRELEEAVAE